MRHQHNIQSRTREAQALWGAADRLVRRAQEKETEAKELRQDADRVSELARRVADGEI